MSDQLNSFATSSKAVADLSKVWHQPATDRQFLYPRLKGMSPKTRANLRSIQPKSVPAFGNTIIYSIFKAGDFVDDMVLELNVSAITQTGGTFAAFRSDMSGAFQEIRIYQGGALLQTRASFNEYVFRDLFLQSYIDSVALQEANGILPFATRSARAAAPQTFYIPLYTLLDYFSCPLSVLTDEIQIQITFKPLINIIQFDGTPGTQVATILSANIRGNFLDASPSLMNDILAASKSGSLPFGIIDFAYLQEAIAAGSLTHRTQLSQFRSLTTYMTGWVQEQQQLFDTSGNPLFEWVNSAEYLTFNVADRGINIASNPDDLPADYVKLHHLPEEFNAYFNPANRFTDFPMAFTWSIQQNLDLHLSEPILTGYYNFDSTQSAYIIVNFPAPIPVPYILSVYGYFANALLLTNGSLRKFIV